MTVPGHDSPTDAILLSLSVLLLAVSLYVGLYRAQGTEAPLSIWPGAIAAIFLALELVIAVLQTVAEIRRLQGGQI